MLHPGSRKAAYPTPAGREKYQPRYLRHWRRAIPVATLLTCRNIEQDQMNRSAFALILLLAASLATQAAEPSPPQSPADEAASRAAQRLPLEPCRPEGVSETVLCGMLEVAENPANLEGRRIQINVVVVPALGTEPRPDPFVELAGGPGVPVTLGAQAFVTDAAFLRKNRDVLLIDMRGTGGSNPLDCDLSTDMPNSDGQLNIMYPVDAVTDCRTALEHRASLEQYHTENFVADIEAVRAWLGYEQLNLAGASYGTKAAMAYMRRHPQRVRSVILTGLAAMDAHAPMHHAPFMQRALELLFARCRADDACNAAYPDLADKMNTLAGRLEREPVRMRRPADDGGEESWLVSRGVFMRAIHSLAYQVESQRRLPWIIDRAFQEDYAPFLDAALRDPLAAMPFAEGLYLSVTCTEDIPFIDRDLAYAMAADTWLGTYRLDQQYGACAHWPSGSVPADFHTAVAADIPVLLISGELDPITPPQQAEAVIRHFAKARHIVLTDGAHGFGGLDNLDCLFGLVQDFLDHADPASLDAACVDTMTPPAWKLAAE